MRWLGGQSDKHPNQLLVNSTMGSQPQECGDVMPASKQITPPATTKATECTTRYFIYPLLPLLPPTACSECYQGVEQYQNMTTTVFKVFVERMNATLSSVDVLGELVRYQQLIQSLHQKAKSLAAEVVVLVNKQNEFVTQDTAFDMSTMAYKTSILTANKGVVGLSARVSIQSALLINLANITDMVEVLEKTITSQIQLSLELLNETQQAVSHYSLKYFSYFLIGLTIPYSSLN